VRACVLMPSLPTLSSQKAIIMTHQWDAFSKSLAEDSFPRRQSLRLLGAAIAGAVFSPLGTAWAAGSDPCKAFCNQCSNKTQRNQCLAACSACNSNTSRLAGSCGRYVCCSTAACRGACSDLKSDPNCGACGNDCRDFGETCCGSYCADLDNDFDNCGACGVACDPPGPNAQGACVGGHCIHWCVEGAVACGETCTFVSSDPNNCGGCGNVCGGDAPYCDGGACTAYNGCGGADLLFDALNCGACGHQCQSHEYCSWGVCDSAGGGDNGGEYGY
jgi:hypothetical protein